MSDAWDPIRYEQFKAERTRPFFDLLSLVQPLPPNASAIDLGCGTGELTLAAYRALAPRHMLGIDSSPAMLARTGAYRVPGLEFRCADVAGDWGTDWDLILSNAALQWLPEHRGLLARLWRCLAPGGQLAVQMPANHDHPSHDVAAALASEAPFRAELAGYVRESPVLDPGAYAEYLDLLGSREPVVRLTVYLHRLPSAEAVVDWTRGTLLTDYQRRLPPNLFVAFLAAYRQRLIDALGAAQPYTYAFKRIFLWARKANA